MHSSCSLEAAQPSLYSACGRDREHSCKWNFAEPQQKWCRGDVYTDGTPNAKRGMARSFGEPSLSCTCACIMQDYKSVRSPDKRALTTAAAVQSATPLVRNYHSSDQHPHSLRHPPRRTRGVDISSIALSKLTMAAVQPRVPTTDSSFWCRRVSHAFGYRTAGTGVVACIPLPTCTFNVCRQSAS